MKIFNEKIAVSILFTLLLAIFPVIADQEGVGAGFEYNIKTVNGSIFIHETATYQLTIVNRLNSPDRFQVSGLGSRFVVFDEPTLESIEVEKDSFATVDLIVDPKDTIGIGPFGVPVKIKSLTSGEFVEIIIPINIKDISIGDAAYPCSVALGVDIEKEVDPREKIIVNILLRNRNPLDIPSLNVFVDGGIFDTKYNLSLGPLEEKGNEIIFDVDPLTKPSSHKINVEVECLERKTTSEKNYEIVGYSSIKEDIKQEKGFFKTVYNYEFFNEGNTDNVVEKKFDVNFFERMFSKTEPKADIVKEFGTTYYSWNLDIESQGTQEIMITTNYRLLVVIIVIILLLIISYYVFRSPVVVGKDSLFSKWDSQGSSELKIKIFMRNRSRSPIHNVKVIDRIPGVGELAKTKEIGTMHPDKVVKDPKKGTIIRWNLDALEPYEERIITYTIKSKLKIIGNVRLPSVKVKFDSRGGSERVAESGPITVTRNKN